MSLGGLAPEIDVLEARLLLESGQALALDVREPHEWLGAHIAGALHIPLGELAARLHELPRARAIVAVCRSGSRSALVARALREQGRTVVNLSGGMLAWQARGLPVEPVFGRVV